MKALVFILVSLLVAACGEANPTSPSAQEVAQATLTRDSDGDGVPDVKDAFPEDAAESLDTDGDGIGNNADDDDDGDGVPDADDAFPLLAGESVDTDGDGIGDNADSDDDGDGVSDQQEVACASDPLAKSSLPTDLDGDGVCDILDADKDGDGIFDFADAFPLDKTEWLDSDRDGAGDNADPDRDNDGYANAVDAFPYDPTEWADLDNDGVGDNLDTDVDGDGYTNMKEDACGSDAWSATSVPLDTDGDGICDVLDRDADGDGVFDVFQNYPPVFATTSGPVFCPAGMNLDIDAKAVDPNGAIQWMGGATTCAWATFDTGTGRVSGVCPQLNGVSCQVEIFSDDGSGPISQVYTVVPNNVRFVSTVAKGAMDGTSWTDATDDVQAAADALSIIGGDVWIERGTYYAKNSTAVVDLPDGVDVYGGFYGTEVTYSQRGEVDAAATILSGDRDRSSSQTYGDAHNVVIVTGTNYLESLTIERGYGKQNILNKWGAGLASLWANLRLSNIRFERNKADVGGGLLVRGGTFEGENLYFSNNNARQGGGIQVIGGANGSLRDSYFANNYVDIDGAAINVLDGTTAFSITNTTFKSNGNVGTRRGAGVNVDKGAQAWIYASAFTGNLAHEGGAVSLKQWNSAVSIVDSLFDNNHANQSGGGGGIRIDAGKAFVTNSTLKNNRASSGPGGAGAIASGAGVYFRHVTAETNTAHLKGGAFYVVSSALEVYGGHFTGNTAGGDGGAGAFVGNATVSLNNVRAETNTSAEDGGAFTSYSANLDIINSSLSKNSSEIHGGALHAVNTALVVTGTTLAANSATGQGGAVFLENSSLDVYAGNFTGNTSNNFGGAIEAIGESTVTIKRSKITANRSVSGEGGGIKQDGGRLDIIDSLIAYNRSWNFGAGVRFWGEGSLAITHSTLAYNTAAAGAVYGTVSYSNTTVQVANSILHGNYADNIHAQGGGTLSVSHTCSEDDFSGSNTTTATNPFVPAASGELFLDPVGDCVDSADETIADSTYMPLGQDWFDLTTDISGTTTEMDGTGMPDPGPHYEPSRAWIISLTAASGTVDWQTNPSTSLCTLSNDTNENTVTVGTGDLPVGNRAVTEPVGTTFTLTCENVGQLPPVVAKVVLE